MTGHWFVDDVDLDGCAFAITDRSAGWSVAPRRGENYRVPGRDGSIPNREMPWDENTLVLKMFAAGANADGTFPTGSTRAIKVRENLDTLSRLFSKRGLMEFVHSERTDYGRVNLLPNPSMENSGQKLVLRENVIANPSGEYSSGDHIIRHNFVDNPGMEAAQAEQAFRTNLAPNPRMANESQPVILRRNHVPNPSGEVGTRFWRAQVNSAIFTSRRTRVGATWPTQGQQSIRMVAVAAGSASAECTSIPVVAANIYSFSGYVWNRTETSMTCRIAVRWFDKNGAFISASSNFDTAVGIDQTARLSAVNQTAPALSTTAVIRFTLVSALQDDVMYIDGAMCTQTAALVTYFDGDSVEVDGLRHRWIDAAGRSRSEQYYVAPKGWMTTGTHSLMATTDYSRRGSQSAKVSLNAVTITNEVIFKQTAPGGCDAQEGDWLSAVISAQMNDAMDGLTRSLKINLRCYDSSGNDLGVVTDAGGSSISDITLNLSSNNWTEVVFETGKARADTAKVIVEVKCGQAWAVGDVVYLDCAMVEPAKKVGDYFDGNSDDDDLFTNVWLGDHHWSASEQRGSNVQGWSATDCRQYQGTNGYLREFSCQLQPYRTPTSTDRPSITQTPLDIRPGRDHVLSAWVKLNRSFAMIMYYSLDGGLTWTSGGGATPTINTYTRLTFAFNIAATQDPALFQIRIAANAAPADGDTIDIDCVMLEPSEGVRNYFDGASGKRFGWDDDEDRSESVKYGDRANGWSAYGSAFPSIQRIASSVAVDRSYVIRTTANESGTLGITAGQDGIDSDNAYSFGINVRASTALTGNAGIAWFDQEGTYISESLSGSTGFTTTTARVTVAGVTPPAGATIGAPFVRVASAVTDNYLEVDSAVFGFGAATDFKDGSSGSGWIWNGVKDNSTSKQIGVGLDFWDSQDGTLAQNGSWSTNRTYNGSYTTTAASATTRIWAFSEKSDDQSRFKINNEFVTFAVDVKAVAACQVQIQLKMRKRQGQGWVAATGATDYVGTKVAFSAGQVQRIFATVNLSLVQGDATHFRPFIYLYSSGGGNPSIGTVIRVDSASLSRDSDSAYQDGGAGFPYVTWLGTADASASRRKGPAARRIMVQRSQMIDFTSLGWGTTAEFVVELTAPYVFWEDTISKTQQLALPRSGGVLRLDTFSGTTAPINDASIKINGPIHDFTITDVGTGEWIRVNDRLKDDENIIISNDDWTVKTKSGKSKIKLMSFSAGATLFPITVPNDDDVPRVKIEADSIGRGAYIAVTARQKYLMA